MSGVRVVSVGGTMTTEVPPSADVRVLPGYTLVKTAEGRVLRLIERGGEVVEAPMTTTERWHVLAMFGEREA
jgi:hypothetical protein